VDDAQPSDGDRQSNLLTYEAQLAAVLESITDGFYALDSSWRYVIFNRAAEAYFGVSRDDVLGRTMDEVFPQGRGTYFELRCKAAMEAGETSRFEIRSRLRPDRMVELRISPMRGGAPRPRCGRSRR
jgi:PAS domain S-box-containing protein